MPRPLWRLAPLAIREQRSGRGRPRIPEPMVMDEPESVADFHAGGATAGGMLAVYDLNARALDALVPEGGRLLDLGTGSGRALQRFLTMRPDVTVTACDLAPNMLVTARRALDAEGVGGRVSLACADITALPDEVMGQRWDAISCVWALHHLPDRTALGAVLRQVAELRTRHGGAVWLLDFQRLRRAETFSEIVGVLDCELPPILRADGLASEAAAFTCDELRAELAEAGLDDLDSGLARPIPWLQAFWSHARIGRGSSQRARLEPLRASARLDATLLRLSFSRLPRPTGAHKVRRATVREGSPPTGGRGETVSAICRGRRGV